MDHLPPGTLVECDSPSFGRWLPGTALAYHPSSEVYDLDIRSQTPRDRIRLASSVDASSVDANIHNEIQAPTHRPVTQISTASAEDVLFVYCSECGGRHQSQYNGRCPWPDGLTDADLVSVTGPFGENTLSTHIAEGTPGPDASTKRRIDGSRFVW